MPLNADEFRIKYSLILGWIKRTLELHAARARRVSDAGFPRLPRYFSAETLETTKVVTVGRAVPVPPLSDMGLAQFAEMEEMSAGGITYLDTFFVTRSEQKNESLYFHELIHVVQWRRLGAERFLAAYADGLERFGYRNSPLEVMAYDAQKRFDACEIFDAEELVVAQLPRV
jgi:hypothetical protein